MDHAEKERDIKFTLRVVSRKVARPSRADRSTC